MKLKPEALPAENPAAPTHVPSDGARQSKQALFVWGIFFVLVAIFNGMSFALIFIGVSLWAAIYLWRRSAVVIWLGDGLHRFVLNLF